MESDSIYTYVVTHPSKDEPSLADRFAFAKDLLGPIHGCQRRRRAAPLGTEFGLADGWNLAGSFDTALLRTAVEDFTAFMEVEMNTAAVTDGATIVVGHDADLGQSETFALSVKDNQVVVTGADDRGIMRAFHEIERRMREAGGPFLAHGEVVIKPVLETRLFRSPVASYAKEAAGHFDGDHYHENILARISHHGFNAIWLKANLRHLIRPVGIEWGGGAPERRCLELTQLIDRAARFGLDVYLHMQEPLGFAADDPFWHQHPELQGDYFELGEGFYSLCSSTSAVREYLELGYQQLFERLPGLKGVTVITASEHQSHCYTRYIAPDITVTYEHLPIHEVHCPRCRVRHPWDVAAEIIELIHRGMKAAAPDARLLAWNWSWSQWEADPQENMLARIPDGVELMADTDRGGHYRLQGLDLINDEYSLTYPGPSERFKKTAAYLRKTKRGIFGKVQISTTHEAGTLPHLPVPFLLAEKLGGLEKEGWRGGMFTWNFGNFTSIISDLASTYFFADSRTADEKIRAVIRRNYGEEVEAYVYEAWQAFSESARFYPKDAWSFATQPLNHGPAFPLFLSPSDFPSPASFLDTPVRNHRLADWIHPPWTVQKRGDAFRQLLKGWQRGLDKLAEAQNVVHLSTKDVLAKDYAVARSFANQVECDNTVSRFAELRERFHDGDSSGRQEMLALCQRHLKLGEEMHRLLDIEPRIGYHGEGHFLAMSHDRLNTAATITQETERQLHCEVHA